MSDENKQADAATPTEVPTYNPAPSSPAEQPRVRHDAKWELSVRQVARQAAEAHGLGRDAEDLLGDHLVGSRATGDVTKIADAFLERLKNVAGKATGTSYGKPPIAPDTGPAGLDRRTHLPDDLTQIPGDTWRSLDAETKRDLAEKFMANHGKGNNVFARERDASQRYAQKKKGGLPWSPGGSK